MMQAAIEKLTEENRMLRSKVSNAESMWVKEQVRREVYADMVATFIEKMVEK